MLVNVENVVFYFCFDPIVEVVTNQPNNNTKYIKKTLKEMATMDIKFKVMRDIKIVSILYINDALDSLNKEFKANPSIICE